MMKRQSDYHSGIRAGGSLNTEQRLVHCPPEDDKEATKNDTTTASSDKAKLAPRRLIPKDLAVRRRVRPVSVCF